MRSTVDGEDKEKNAKEGKWIASELYMPRKCKKYALFLYTVTHIFLAPIYWQNDLWRKIIWQKKYLIPKQSFLFAPFFWLNTSRTMAANLMPSQCIAIVTCDF